MKRRHFTLIEMLVVIAVISILIGILIPTIGTVMAKVKGSQTKAVINSLRLGIKQYESTYGILPFTGENADKFIEYTPGSSATNSEYTILLNTLEGNDTSLNPRGIKFLDLSDADYLDAWDEELNVVLDLDYNSSIDSSLIYGSGTLNTEIVIWSAGPDGDHDSDDSHADNADNVKSWDK
jgi:prepilin-type N-terminal cleavage/methylation domain-containing protein